MRLWRALLIVVAVVCFGVALSYPIRYRMAQESNNSELEELSAMRARAREQQALDLQVPGQTAAAPADETGAAVVVPGTEAGTTAARDIASDGTVTVPGGESDGIAAAPGTGTAIVAPGTEAGISAAQDIASDGTAAASGTGTAVVAPGTEAGVPAARDAASDGAATASGNGTGTAVVAPGTETGETAVQAGALDVEAVTPPPVPTDTPRPTPTPGMIDIADELWMISAMPPRLAPTPTPMPTGPTPVPTPSPEPSPTPDRSIRRGALPYPSKEKVELDEAKILPELREIYELNHDLVGWILIPNTLVDYPVVQTEDSEYYLDHDFYGNDNINGQIILDTLCDPYTPSYNLVISGHHMKNESMFGGLTKYASKSYWSTHRFVEFDSLMTRKQYVIFAAFYSADYDEDEEGFRYNADIQYRKDAEMWLSEIHENEIYDTGIDAEFGDEFITLTTCSHARRRDGRFVLVCRRIREGERFE